MAPGFYLMGHCLSLGELLESALVKTSYYTFSIAWPVKN